RSWLGKIDRRTRPAQGPRHREGEDYLRPWAGSPMSLLEDHAVANRTARLPQERARDRNRAQEAAPARIHMRRMRNADGPSLKRMGPSMGRFASKAALKRLHRQAVAYFFNGLLGRARGVPDREKDRERTW